jgi:hypothetical protein
MKLAAYPVRALTCLRFSVFSASPRYRCFWVLSLSFPKAQHTVFSSPNTHAPAPLSPSPFTIRTSKNTGLKVALLTSFVKTCCSTLCHPESPRFWRGEGSAFRFRAPLSRGYQQSHLKSHRITLLQKTKGGGREPLTRPPATDTSSRTVSLGGSDQREPTGVSERLQFLDTSGVHPFLYLYTSLPRSSHSPQVAATPSRCHNPSFELILRLESPVTNHRSRFSGVTNGIAR